MEELTGATCGHSLGLVVVAAAAEPAAMAMSEVAPRVDRENDKGGSGKRV
jgi:malonyl CoA-acyl carrier protein transacylase